jgi:hypothetical protein
LDKQSYPADGLLSSGVCKSCRRFLATPGFVGLLLDRVKPPILEIHSEFDQTCSSRPLLYVAEVDKVTSLSR